MANTKSAAKRARQTARRTLTNRRSLSAVKHSLKEVRAAVKAGKKDDARALAQRFASLVDKATKSGRLHRNAANRHKSNVARALAKIG
jgi:small subunit ribosomal protein S20